MATVATRDSGRRQGSGFHRRQCRGGGGTSNVICSFWLQGRCRRYPCQFMHAQSESGAAPRPKQFQAPKSRTWKRTPNNSSCVKNSSVLPSGEDDNIKKSSVLPSGEDDNGSSAKNSSVLPSGEDDNGSSVKNSSVLPGGEDDNIKKSSVLPSGEDDSSSSVKNSSVLPGEEDGPEDINDTERVQDGPEDINDTERVQDEVCRHWLGGKCVRGEDCKYLHSWSCGNGFSMFTKLDGHSKAVKGIALPSGSCKLFTGCKDKTVRVWDCNTGQCVQVVEFSSEVGSLINEGPWVFVGLEDAVKVWNTRTGNELTLLGPVGLVRALATKDDMLFAATQDGTILAWKFRSENEPPELIASLKGHSCAVICLTIGANKMYSGSLDNTIRVWDLSTLLCVQILEGHSGAVMSVLCWDKYLLSCSLDGSIKAWGATEAGDMEMIYTHEEEYGVLGLCGLIDAEGKPILLCSCYDNYVSLYELPTFAERGKLFTRQEVRAIQIGPAGTGLFFTGDATGQITVWKLDAADRMQS